MIISITPETLCLFPGNTRNHCPEATAMLIYCHHRLRKPVVKLPANIPFVQYVLLGKVPFTPGIGFAGQQALPV